MVARVFADVKLFFTKSEFFYENKNLYNSIINNLINDMK